MENKDVIENNLSKVYRSELSLGRNVVIQKSSIEKNAVHWPWVVLIWAHRVEDGFESGGVSD